MQLYRFSPIQSESELLEAVSYVVKTCAKLFFRDTGRMTNDLIKSVTIFSHYPEEYEMLKQLLGEMGELYNENNGPRFKLRENLDVVVGNLEVTSGITAFRTHIEFIRVRQPDPYRAQVGCCDYQDTFEIEAYEHARSVVGVPTSPRLIERETYSMLEFFAPDLDVLGYVVRENA